jgi:hypothetical protein
VCAWNKNGGGAAGRPPEVPRAPRAAGARLALNFNADLLFMNLLNVINLIIATPEELSLYFLGAALGEYQAARIHTLS